MLDFVTPSLLWGATAVSAPILIHLLMRQKPRPRPWAAMRWLLAAVQVAQRRYKLTNLLLLLLRCLLLALLALALARPSLSGVGSGGSLVLVLDATASMGATAEGGGALHRALVELEQAGLHHQRVAIISIGDGVQVRETSSAELAKTLRGISASALPGGVDLLAAPEHADRLLALCDKDSDVILVSDFRQDDGAQLGALLTGKVRSLLRWQLAGPEQNALVTAVPAGEGLLPERSGELLLKVQGEVRSAAIGIDGSQPLERDLLYGEGMVRVQIPGMPAGRHLVQVRLGDRGLVYDDVLELPVVVRAATGAVMVSGNPYAPLAAALQSDVQRLDTRVVGAAELTALPPAGLLVLRTRPSGDLRRVVDWLRVEGGVLWAPLQILRADPQLAGLVDGVALAEGDGTGGPLRSCFPLYNANLARRRLEAMPHMKIPEGAEALLWAGPDVIAAALPAGRGWVLVEAVSLDELERVDIPAWPELMQKLAGRLLTRLDRPEFWTAGAAAPQAATLERDGRTLSFTAGQALLLAPGLWQRRTEQGPRPVVVLPSPSEGRSGIGLAPEAASSLAEALPARPGRDWGPWLLVLVLAIAAVEGALAAWAGRTYGK